MQEKPQLAVGLDAGSACTRCVILAMEEGRLRYLGHGEVPSSGWHKSRLTDQQALTRSVQDAIHQAEAEAHAATCQSCREELAATRLTLAVGWHTKSRCRLGPSLRPCTLYGPSMDTVLSLGRPATI